MKITMKRIKTKIGISCVLLVTLLSVGINISITPNDKSMKLRMANIEACALPETDPPPGACPNRAYVCTVVGENGGQVAYPGVYMAD